MGILSARLERFDVTALITFVLAGGISSPSRELVNTLAEVAANPGAAQIASGG